MRAWFLGVLLFVGLIATVVSFAVSAVALAQADDPAKPPPIKAGPAPTLETKVFRLEHCDPVEVRTVLAHLLEPDSPQQQAPGIVLPPGIAGSPGSGVAGGFAALGGIVTPWPAEIRPNSTCRLSVATRSGTLIVRGKPQDLQVASDLVAVLDLPPGKPLPKVRTVQAISPKHATPWELAAAIRELNIPVRVVALEEAKMLLGTGAEEALREMTNLVNDLDVPERTLDEKKLKRLRVSEP